MTNSQKVNAGSGASSEAPVNRLLSATVTIFCLWETVLCAVREDNRHPSPEYLELLIRETGGVPEFARWYVDGLGSGEISRPRGQPTPYLTPDEIRTMGNMCMPVCLHPRVTYAREMLFALHYRLKKYETRDPKVGNRGVRFRWAKFLTSEGTESGIPLRYYRSRGVWKIREPKVQARKLLAKRLGVQPSYLEDWERDDSLFERPLPKSTHHLHDCISPRLSSASRKSPYRQT